MKREAYPWEVILATMTLIVLGNLCANIINGDALYRGWVGSLADNIWFKISAWLLTIALFMKAFFYLYIHGKQYLPFRVVAQNDKTEPHKAMIIILSSPGKETSVEFHPDSICVIGGSKTITVQSSRTLGDRINYLEGDIQLLEETKWPWQQMMRGLNCHINSVEYLFIIGSKDSPNKKQGDMLGSFVYVKHAISLIKKYKPTLDDTNIRTYHDAIDFEDFKQVKDAITSGINWLNDYVSETDIIIDITGGQKTASIAGAMATLSTGVTFQYVQTGGDNKVCSYDLESYKPPSTD